MCVCVCVWYVSRDTCLALVCRVAFIRVVSTACCAHVCVCVLCACVCVRMRMCVMFITKNSLPLRGVPSFPSSFLSFLFPVLRVSESRATRTSTLTTKSTGLWCWAFFPHTHTPALTHTHTLPHSPALTRCWALFPHTHQKGRVLGLVPFFLAFGVGPSSHTHTHTKHWGVGPNTKGPTTQCFLPGVGPSSHTHTHTHFPPALETASLPLFLPPFLFFLFSPCRLLKPKHSKKEFSLGDRIACDQSAISS